MYNAGDKVLVLNPTNFYCGWIATVCDTVYSSSSVPLRIDDTHFREPRDQIELVERAAYTRPDPRNYPTVSHWSGCDVEQPFDLAYEAWARDLEELDRSLDDLETRGPVFRQTYPDGEIPF